MLIAIIERPTSDDAAAASAAIGDKHPIVSLHAQREFLAPPLGQGNGELAGLTKFLTERQGVMRPDPTQQTIEALESRGLEHSDALVVGAGAEVGIKTLTKDADVLKRVPELSVPY